MSDVRVVSFDGLLKQLHEVLGEDSLLYQRFAFALRNRDENAIEAAMQSLDSYPETIKQSVQDTMLAWLFGGNQTIAAANSNDGSQALH